MSATVEEAAFLAAICADPADDTPRLVYADWLQENGREEQAEFIRVQCEAVRSPEPPSVMVGTGFTCSGCLALGDALCRYHALEHRELLLKRSRDLVRELIPGAWRAKGWMLSSGGIALDDEILLRLSRGFVAEVTCSAASWLADGDAIRAERPVTAVRLTTRPSFSHSSEGMCLNGDPERRTLSMDDVYSRGKSIAPDSGYIRRPLLGLLSLRWPGITFEFPT